MKRCTNFILSLILIIVIVVSSSACSSTTPEFQSTDLMEDTLSKTVSGKTTDDKFISNTMDLSIQLFKKTSSDNKNSLISPLSVMLALAMTANGADKETLSQMELVLGKEIPLEDLNEYLFTYVKNLPSKNKSKLNIANSIWFRDEENRLTVEEEFLQKNADYYNASVYKSAFDAQTIKDINNWVKTNTDGLIDTIINQIEEDTIMYLINAIVFDAQWKDVYNKNELIEGDFTTADANLQTAEFMYSQEGLYIEDDKAIGFIKPYFDDQYSFVALLPNKDVSIEDYIETLTGEGFLNTINKATNVPVNASLPKFSYDFTIKMNDALKALGITDGFSASKADFLKLGQSTRGNIYIGEVIHKTFISVDELGTKAGAVTKVEMKDESYNMETKVVKLDRPFVYAIIDNATNLPIFIGKVMSLEN